MTVSTRRRAGFRKQLHERQPLLGTFVKTPSPHATEVLAVAGFDFVVLDAEHAPLDRVTLDLMVLAAWSRDLPALVRVPEANAAAILNALDCGATGVLVPHVDSAERAKEVVMACRYRGGRRGYSSTTRSGGWGTATMGQHIEASDAQATCVAMIEDLAALEQLEDILAVPGLDAVFIGRGDIAAAMGLTSSADQKVHAVVQKIATAARNADLPVMVMPSNKADAQAMQALGASAYILQNDQSLLLRAAQQVLQDFRVLD